MQHGSLITVSEVCTIAAFVLSVEAIAVANNKDGKEGPPEDRNIKEVGVTMMTKSCQMWSVQTLHSVINPRAGSSGALMQGTSGIWVTDEEQSHRKQSK